MKRSSILLILCLALGTTSYYYLNRQVTKLEKKATCKPTFPDGDGPYYQPNAPFRNKIVPDQNNGEKLIITGMLLQEDCDTPVPGATIDIWQANEAGNYDATWYRGQIITDKRGNYEFETVLPKGYGEGTGRRPPHIHFKIRIKDQLIITSEMFFPEVAGTPGFDDAYIMKLVTKQEQGKSVHYGSHDIILPKYL